MRRLFIFFLCVLGPTVTRAQISAPEVVLHEGHITSQTSFLPAGAASESGTLHPGQGGIGDGVYFGGYLWIAMPVSAYNGQSGPQIVLFPVAGTSAPGADEPLPFALGKLNNDLFTPQNNVELVAWGEELWVISWDTQAASDQVHFAPLTLNPSWDSGNPQSLPFFATNPGSSGNFIQSDNVTMSGLSAELINDELTIFTWTGDHLDGYHIGVTSSSKADFFGDTHYISLGEQLHYTGLFDTHVFIGGETTNIPGAELEELNVLFVAVSENCGKGGNQNILMQAIPASELKSTDRIDTVETPYLANSGIFTEDPFTAYSVRVSDGACDFQNSQLFGVGGVTLAIFGQVPEAPHFPWFVATAPLLYSFGPSTDTGSIPEFSYPSGGFIPSQDPNFAFGLGVQRVLVDEPVAGTVQDYAVFATLSGLADQSSLVGQFQAAPANQLQPLPRTVVDTSVPASQGEAEALSEAWTLLGVIHGPPPAAFNDDPGNNTSVSFEWSSSSTDGTSLTVSQSNNTQVSFTGQRTTPVFQAKLEVGNTLTDVTKTNTVNQVTIANNSGEHTLNAISGNAGNEVLNQGFLIYLMPEFNNQAYKTFSFRGNDLETVAFVSWIGKTTLQPVEYTINNTNAASNFNSSYLLNLSTGMANTPGVIDLPAWSEIPADPNSAEVSQDLSPGLYSEGMPFTNAAIDFTNTKTRTNTNETTEMNFVKSEIKVGFDATTPAGKWGFHVGLNISGSQTKTNTLATTTSKTFKQGITYSMQEILVPDSAPPAGSAWYSSVTITPFLLLPDEPGQGDWIPSSRQGDQPFLLTWTAAATPIQAGTGDIPYASVFPWLYDREQQKWFYVPVEYAPERGVVFSNVSGGWLYSPFFGWTGFGDEPESFGGWVYSERFGWMRFERAGQDLFLWIPMLNSWFRVNGDGSYTSSGWGRLVPEGMNRYQSSVFGGLTTGDFGGWVAGDRFGWMWTNGDGTWFWSHDRQEWMGVTSGGGIWSTAEQRFL
ncbi:MAG: hypothetical protein ACLFRP_02405 [Puniceicoccaceae bacterium]